MKKRRSGRRARRGKNGIGILLVLVLAVAFIGGMLWLALAPDKEADDSSTPSLPAAPTSSATASTVSSTTKATSSTTTVTTTIRTQAPASSELLQYDATGRYVQQTVSDWRLLLVNDWNAIDANYEKSVTMVSAGKRGQKADSRILEDLNAMLAAGAEYGIDVQSGYRSYDHQSTLYWRQVNNFKNNGYNDTAAQTAAGKIVKRPGYSEHNSGLAVDLGGSGNFLLDESFANTAAYKWLIENCADYGFILRFPKDKEEITGVIYEAWHFRYVGKEAATYIMENNLCLEEYLEQQGL